MVKESLFILASYELKNVKELFVYIYNSSEFLQHIVIDKWNQTFKLLLKK